MPPPPPPLMDEPVEEVLLRLPPDSPASLVRAGLVCKRWCHLVIDPAFWRRFLDFHGRAPPMVGFMINSRGATRFVPMSASGALQPHGNLCGLKAFDSRHGRVLLRNTGSDDHHMHMSIRIVVWNPTTGEQLKLPEPPRCYPYEWTAAVLCAAAGAGGGACEHLDCNRGPFIVVLVGTTTHRKNLVRIYSSEAGAWSAPTFASHSGDDSIDSWVRSTLVGNTLYFALHGHGSGMSSDYQFGDNRRTRYRYNCQNILEYNLGTRRTSVVQLPRAGNSMFREPFEQIELTTTEDGRLGFVRVEHYSTLCLWSREVEEPAAGWALRKTIQLAHLLPSDGHLPWEWVYWRYLVGSAEGVGTIFLRLKGDELLTADLWSRQVTKVYTHQGACLTTVIPIQMYKKHPALTIYPST